MCKIYLLPGEINDATDYYVLIIEESFMKMSYNYKRVYSLKEIGPKDIVLTISAKAFFLVWINRPSQFIMNWFQGIVPEEAMLLFANKPERYLRYWLWSFLEYFVLLNSRCNFFISNAMLTHYKRKYRYTKDNHFIMPCFNRKFNEKCFEEKKCTSLDFVYVGSMSAWQCIEETLALFKHISNNIENTTLSIFTSEIAKIRMLLVKHELTSCVVKYVPYSKIDAELIKYKYGFLLRRNININNVSTPTKMNTYLANGVIPIFNDVISDFSENLNSKFVIKLPEINYEDICVEKIMLIENKIDREEMKKDYEFVFSKYYSHDYYVQKLVCFLQTMLDKFMSQKILR